MNPETPHPIPRATCPVGPLAGPLWGTLGTQPQPLPCPEPAAGILGSSASLRSGPRASPPAIPGPGHQAVWPRGPSRPPSDRWLRMRYVIWAVLWSLGTKPAFGGPVAEPPPLAVIGDSSLNFSRFAHLCTGFPSGTWTSQSFLLRGSFLTPSQSGASPTLGPELRRDCQASRLPPFR